MAYDRYTWQNDIDAINAQKLNHIEQGITEAHLTADRLQEEIPDRTFEPQEDESWKFEKETPIRMKSSESINISGNEIEFECNGTYSYITDYGFSTEGDIEDKYGTLDEVRQSVKGLVDGGFFEKESGDPDDYWMFTKAEPIQIDSTEKDLNLRGKGYINITDRLSNLKMQIDGYLKKFTFLDELGSNIIEFYKNVVGVFGTLTFANTTSTSTRPQTQDNSIHTSVDYDDNNYLVIEGTNSSAISLGCNMAIEETNSVVICTDMGLDDANINYGARLELSTNTPTMLNSGDYNGLVISSGAANLSREDLNSKPKGGIALVTNNIDYDSDSVSELIIGEGLFPIIKLRTIGDSDYISEIYMDESQMRLEAGDSDAHSQIRIGWNEVLFENNNIYTEFANRYKVLFNADDGITFQLNDSESSATPHTVFKMHDGKVEITAPNGFFVNGTRIG